jgi:heat shock protein HtpX
MTGLLMLFGAVFGGEGGMIIAFLFAIAMNFGTYLFSDKIVMAIYRAKEVTPQEAPALHRIVDEVARAAGIPKPRVCVVPMDAPNAFATGRGPSHGVVAATTGILQILDERELRGVIAHEIGHIKNRDTLIQCIAAAIAGAITMIATMARWAMIFGGRDDEDNNIVVMLLFAILAPVAALMVQMAISRTREYQADASAAGFTHNPYGLASALEKLGAASGRIPMRFGSPSTSHLFIVNPLKNGFIANMFSTHPPIEDRIKRLNSIRPM